ncbi:MAG: regulatory protein GemA [Pseudomonadota bacterium]
MSVQPARAPQSRQHRSLQRKVKVGQKQLRLSDDEYRDILWSEATKTSSSECSISELERIVSRMVSLGFKPMPKKGAKRTAQHPMAKKARAMWISLHQLGAIRNPSEKALEAFAKRQLGCDRLILANQSHAFRLIEALKAMAERNGWRQTDDTGNNLGIRELKHGLCEAILAKLVRVGEVPTFWTIYIAAYRLCGIELGSDGPVSAEGYADLAGALGAKLNGPGGVV